jgi:antitoxin component of MazEF toxin-antitoxin module
MGGMSQEKKETGEAKESKIEISKLLAIVPPASELKKKETSLKEKRIRVQHDPGVDPSKLKIPSELAKILGVKDGDTVELVVAGKRKFTYTAQVFESNDLNIVLAHPDELVRNGVADNSIATVRKAHA